MNTCDLLLGIFIGATLLASVLLFSCMLKDACLEKSLNDDSYTLSDYICVYEDYEKKDHEKIYYVYHSNGSYLMTTDIFGIPRDCVIMGRAIIIESPEED